MKSDTYTVKNKRPNLQIYNLHLKLADFCSNFWPRIQRANDEKLQKDCSFRYKILDNKLTRLTQQQTRTTSPKHTFHHKVVNKTDISFSESEMTILRKCPKYKVQSKHKVWLQTLVLEAETAITLFLHQNRKYTGS